MKRKKECAKAFKPLHVQEQIPIIDLGWVSLSLLFIRSCWSVFIFFFSPPSAKQTKTQILRKLLVVRNVVTGMSSQEELLESYQSILVRSSMTKGSTRLHTERKSERQYYITIWFHSFVLKSLCSPTKGSRFNFCSGLSTPESTTISAPKLPLAVSVLMVCLTIAWLVMCQGCIPPLFCDLLSFILLESPTLLIKSWRKDQLIGSPIRLAVSFKTYLNISKYFLFILCTQTYRFFVFFLFCLTYVFTHVTVGILHCSVGALGAYFIWNALKISLVKWLERFSMLANVP